MNDECASCGCSVTQNTPRICSDCDRQFKELRGALDNLVKEVRGISGPRLALGMRLSVALNVAERALRIRAVDKP